jgi:ABC-type Mn2+/Zn2+ transport system permease subunit/Mn-dependent DtxR family transcriptional regulator
MIDRLTPPMVAPPAAPAATSAALSRAANVALFAVAGAVLATGVWWVDRSPSRAMAWWTVLVAAVSSCSCGLLGCFLVLRRMSLLGDAISHAVLPGIVLAFLVSGKITGLPIVLGAMVLGVLTSFLTQTLHDQANVPEDSGMGVVFTSLFALGVLLITRYAAQVDLDPGCVLYGLLEFVTLEKAHLFGVAMPRVLLTLGPALVLTIAFIVAFWKELKLTSFDAALATAMGFRAAWVHYLLMAMVAAVTVASFEAVGSILVVAMIIVPAATAHLLTDRLSAMLGWSVVVSLISSLYGYAFAERYNTSVAGTMAVVAGVQFAAAVFFAPRHGAVAKWFGNVRLALRIAGEDLLATLFRSEEAQPLAAASTVASRASRTIAQRLSHWWLARRGLVRRAADGSLALTPRGRDAGRSLVRAHRLWESYLDQNFGIPLDHVHAPAERMEHFIGPALETDLVEELQQPQHDPHGREIPAP